jgi:hypothetical protein
MATHSALTGSELHEPKGAANADVNMAYIADGEGSGVWTTLTSLLLPGLPGTVSQGVYDYNDVTTTSTAIPLTAATVAYKLTNDAAGSSTNTTYALAGLANVWEGLSVNQFDWTTDTKLALGDSVDIRFDVEYTTTAVNTEVSLELHVGVGDPNAYTLQVIGNENIVSAGTVPRIVSFGLYMGDSTTLTFPTEVWARASKVGTTVKVNGWYIRVLHTNI